MIFTKDSQLNDALELPEGRLAADFGFQVEQSIEPQKVLDAATALIKSGEEFTPCASQANIMVTAQKIGVCFQDWATLSTF